MIYSFLTGFRISIILVSLLLSSTISAAAESMGTAQYVQLLSSSEWQVRRDAAMNLGALGSNDKSVMAKLVSALHDDDSRVRRAAAAAIGDIGRGASKAIPDLVMLFDDIDPSVIEASVRAIGLMGSRASRARNDLTMLLDHSSPRLRSAAATSLGQIGRRASRSKQKLAEHLSDPDPAVRAAAATSLGAIGTRAANDSSKLVRLLADGDPRVRDAASQSLSQIGKPAVEILIRSLGNGDPILLQSVVETLGNIGAPAAPKLVKALHDPAETTMIRQYSATALASVGPANRRVIPALIKTLDDENPDLRRAAAEALGQIGPPAELAAQRLIEIASDQRENLLVREFSIAALAHISPENAAVQSTLVNAVADGDPRIYEAAISALVSIRKMTAAETNIPDLIRTLEYGNPDARIAAAQRLGEAGPYAAVAVPVLTAVLAATASSSDLRVASAQTLGLIGPAAEAAVPQLIRMLKHDDHALSSAALVSLGRIGRQSGTVQALIESLNSDDLATRAAAAAKLERFALARIDTWEPLLLQSAAPVVRNWLARHEALYGVELAATRWDSVNSDVNTADYFDVLGGRAAIRESIQLDLIAKPLVGIKSDRRLPVSRLRTINVRSHPFEDMLDSSETPDSSLPLSEFAPADRFFAYFRNVASLRNALSGGTEQFLRFESALAVKNIEYDVEQQYLKRFGLDAGMLDKLQAIGGIGELAIIMPDLFVVDGTDLTAVATLVSPGLTKTVLQLLGLDGSGDEIETLVLSNGHHAWWAIRGNVLAISSNRNELSTVLAASDDGGKLSLARSDEFRFMLQQLDINDSTEAYLYFPDQFIRHLVSPQVKIAQLRRMQARAELEMLVSGALLYLLDGRTNVPSMDVLVERNYLPRYFEDRDYSISENLIATSAMYGTLAAPEPLSANPVLNVSDRERDAYNEFVDNYSRYWRQFFDPIAIRIDRIDDNTHELSTFILPLLDSRLYDEVQNALVTAESGRALAIPVLSPNPSMLVSLNISDNLRVTMSQALAGTLVQYTSVDPEIFDSIGSGIHLAVQDSTPIVALGSGDIWGALDQNMLRMEGFESLLPFLLSLMTQPATVLFELAEPDRVREFLNDAVVSRHQVNESGQFYRLQDKEAWIYSLNMLDMFQLHLRIEVSDGFLLVSNLPWSTQLDVTGVSVMRLNGARLQLNMDEITQQLPALHTKVFADYRAAAVDGMGYLYPILATGLADTVPEAIDTHYNVFGFTPVHPHQGRWIWKESYLESTEFGTARKPVQPEFRPGQKDFGVFPTIERISLNMQLERAGLRASIRWHTVQD